MKSIHLSIPSLKMLKLPFAVSMASARSGSCESIGADLTSSHRRLLSDNGKSRGYVVGLTVSVPVILLLLVAAVLIWWWREEHRRIDDEIGYRVDVGGARRISKQHRSIDEEIIDEEGPRSAPHNVADEIGLQVDLDGARSIAYHAIVEATGSFSDANVLGEGTFGVVYRAEFKQTGRVAAVKKLKSTFEYSKKEFIAEIETIGKLRHPNLVQLQGYCYRGSLEPLLLVYELVPNHNLHKHLFDTKTPPISWPNRYRIARGLASGLKFLHSGARKCVIHRDIKPENVMLDEGLNAKLGDFGLARVTEHDHSMNSTAQGGTVGYKAPEIWSGLKASAKSDVFSYGIVALHIATGKKIDVELAGAGKIPLLSWVWDQHAKGSILDTVDQRLGGDFDRNEATCLLRVGLWCCYSRPDNRPDMEQVLTGLDSPASPPVVGRLPERESYYRGYMSSCRAQGSDAAPRNLLQPYSSSSSSGSSLYYTPAHSEPEIPSLPSTSHYLRKITQGNVVELSDIEE